MVFASALPSNTICTILRWFQIGINPNLPPLDMPLWRLWACKWYVLVNFAHSWRSREPPAKKTKPKGRLRPNWYSSLLAQQKLEHLKSGVKTNIDTMTACQTRSRGSSISHTSRQVWFWTLTLYNRVKLCSIKKSIKLTIAVLSWIHLRCSYPPCPMINSPFGEISFCLTQWRSSKRARFPCFSPLATFMVLPYSILSRVYRNIEMADWLINNGQTISIFSWLVVKPIHLTNITVVKLKIFPK